MSLFVCNFRLGNGDFCCEIAKLSVGNGLSRVPSGLLRVVLSVIMLIDKVKSLIISCHLKIKGCSDYIEQLLYRFPGGPDDNLIEGGGSKFVCKPGARNITIIFHPLLR